MNNRKGFTLIEMLVVVAIVGLLSSVVVVGLGGARSKARDAKRIADIQQIMTNVEVGYTNGIYPDVDATRFLTAKGPQGENYTYARSAQNTQAQAGACLENAELQTPAADVATTCPSGFTCATAPRVYPYCKNTAQ
jgi:prepilin-type N-terminal cleavage/methylation domain-containing protein